MFSFEVKSRGHILAVVDENGFIVIYNTRKTGQLAIMEGMFFVFRISIVLHRFTH
jgi:hypothetical protein